VSRARPGVFSRNAIACEGLAAQQLSFRFQEFSRLGIQEDEGSSKGSFRDMKITPGLFEAYLKCPTKCWLRATGERSAGNSYSEWVNAQNDSYRLTGTPRLVAAFRNDEVLLSRDIENFKVAKWRLAFNFVARAQMDCCTLESEIHASPAIHVDETKISILGVYQQVWGITNGREVVFHLTKTRETGFLQEILKGYPGVLVSDFYGGYDAIKCREQSAWCILLGI
jgi:hypothetical protein